MKISKALILAGGNGTRLGCIDKPKPMFEVGDLPIIERSLIKLSKAGVRQVTMSVHFKKEKITDYFKNQYRDIEIKYCESKPTIGGSITEMAKDIDHKEPMFLIYGDTISDLNFADFADDHIKNEKVLTALGVPKKNTKSFGLLKETSPNKFEFISKHTRRGDEEPGVVDAGNFVINSDILYMFEKYKLDSVDSLMLRLNHINGFNVYVHNGKWIDLNYIEFYEEAQKMFKNDKEE